MTRGATASCPMSSIRGRCRVNRHQTPAHECNLKAVALKAAKSRNALVKRTHKGPLRDVLARNMRRLRATRALSQEALAHECGINRTYLSGVERSERNVSIDGALFHRLRNAVRVRTAGLTFSGRSAAAGGSRG